MAGAEEVRKLSQFGFWEERTEKKKKGDNGLVRGECEDELGISTGLSSEVSLLPYPQEHPAGHITHHPHWNFEQY